jgi:hypothetical protein
MVKTQLQPGIFRLQQTSAFISTKCLPAVIDRAQHPPAKFDMSLITDNILHIQAPDRFKRTLTIDFMMNRTRGGIGFAADVACGITGHMTVDGRSPEQSQAGTCIIVRVIPANTLF